MFALPLQVSETDYALYVFLEDENLERMRKHDPAVVATAHLGPSFNHRLHLREVVVGYSTADDLARVMELCKAGKPLDALRHMTRGFRFRPGQGDHDGPYLSIKPSDEKPS